MKSSSFPRASLLIIAVIVGLFDMATAVTIDNFTKLNTTGICVDSKGKGFTEAHSNAIAYTDDAAMLNYCVSYCGQNLPATFRGFETLHAQGYPTFSCHCRFDMPMPPLTTITTFPYNYTPASYYASGEPGTGAITGTATSVPDFQCYKFNGNATEAPTKAPTKPSSCPAGHPPCITADVDCKPHGFQHCLDTCCANLHTDSPTKAPTKPATNVPTKAPTKPSSPASNALTKKPAGSCPVGHPACFGAADCSGTGFSHCVDGCCANIGSKSAKGTKSSKKV